MYNFFEDNEKIRHKRKLNELMDKYGESTRAINENSTLKDYFDYQFSQPDRYFNEVLEERKRKRAQSSFPQTPFPTALRSNPNYTIPQNPPRTSEENNLDSKTKRVILLERARNTINKFEGITNHFYLDTLGTISIANGKNADDYNVFMRLPLLKGDRSATDIEKNAAYQTLKKKQQEGFYGSDYPAKVYKKLTPLKISKENIDKLTNEHLENDINSLQKTFPEFDNFPLPLQEVLTDIHYNTGNVSQSNWPNLHRGIKNKNLSLIAQHIHRQDVQPERNDWALERIKSITSW